MSGFALDFAMPGPAGLTITDPRLAPMPGDTFGRRLLRTLIGFNVLYLLSAIFYLAGCKLLMRSPVVTQSEFARILLTFGVLQAYEFLIIGSATWIVRRLLILSDAFTLMCIGLTLMLDPTLFSNNFISIFAMGEGGGPGGLYTCLIALAFIPVKMRILQHITRFRLTPRTEVALILAGAFVYLAAIPFNLPNFGFTKSLALQKVGYYYLLAWVPAAVALLLPRMHATVRLVAPPTSDYVTVGQRIFLPPFLLILPLFIIVEHLIEHSQVYELPFRLYMLAPVCCAAGCLLIGQLTAGRSNPAHLYTVDALVLAACYCAAAPVVDRSVFLRYEDNNIAYINEFAVQSFVNTHASLLAIGMGLCSLYAWYWRRTEDTRALRRLALLAVAGGGYVLYRSGLPTIVIHVFIRAWHHIIDWVSKNPEVFAWALWALFVAGLFKFRSVTYRVFVAAFTVPLAAALLPGDFSNCFPEVIQCELAILTMGSVYKHPEDRLGRRVAVFIIAFISFARFSDSPRIIFLIIAAIWITAGLIYAWRARRISIGVIALTLCWFATARFLEIQQVNVRTEFVLIGVGLAVFGLALLTTFNKESLLRHFTPPPPPTAPPPINEERLRELLAEARAINNPPPPPPPDEPPSNPVPLISI